MRGDAPLPLVATDDIPPRAATPADAPAAARRRRGGRALLFVAAFAVMLVAALASMVRFTGERDQGAVEPAPAAATPVERGPGGLVVPVRGVRLSQITDTWGLSRAGGARAHQGTDIMAPGGTPVLAAAAGTVEKLFDSAAGGHTLYVRSTDRRWSYYYAHLAAYAPAVGEGMAVRAGQHIAFVGDTGNSGAGNYHLHFGIARMRPGERWWQGEPVNPYPLLVGGSGGR